MKNVVRSKLFFWHHRLNYRSIWKCELDEFDAVAHSETYVQVNRGAIWKDEIPLNEAAHADSFKT